MVAGAIVSGKKKGDRSTFGLLERFPGQMMLGVKFFEIARPKLTELRRLVIEPLPKIGRRCQFLRPEINNSIGFF